MGFILCCAGKEGIGFPWDERGEVCVFALSEGVEDGGDEEWRGGEETVVGEEGIGRMKQLHRVGRMTR